MTMYIYGLHLEGESEIRYVGSTNDTKRRFWAHLNEYKRRGGSKNEWIKANHARVRMKVLATCEADHKLLEKQTAERLHKQGHRVFNVRRPRRLTKTERADAVKEWFKNRPPRTF